MMTCAAPMNAEAFLDSYQCELDALAAAPTLATAPGVVGGPFIDMLAKANAFRKVREALNSAGVTADDFMSKFLEVLNLIIQKLPDIAAIIAAVLALFGKAP